MNIRTLFSLALAVLAAGLAPAAQAQQLLYIHADHLNTPRMVTNGTGTPVWRWDQTEPFGDNPPNEDPDGNGSLGHMPLRFPGQYYDKETNLQYNYYRDYEPATGRYIQSDPIGIKYDLNSYRYARTNPLFWFDPYGLWTYCMLLSQKCVGKTTIYGSLGLIKIEVCTRRRCLWRCYDEGVNQFICYKIPCKDENCHERQYHGVEVLEYHSGRAQLPYGAAPLCEDENPASRPSGGVSGTTN